MNNKTKKWSILSLIAMVCLSCGFVGASFAMSSDVLETKAEETTVEQGYLAYACDANGNIGPSLNGMNEDGSYSISDALGYIDTLRLFAGFGGGIADENGNPFIIDSYTIEMHSNSTETADLVIAEDILIIGNGNQITSAQDITISGGATLQDVGINVSEGSIVNVDQVTLTGNSWIGENVTTDENGKVIDGKLISYTSKDAIADGFDVDENGEVVVATKFVATIDGVGYASALDALKAAIDNGASEIKFLADVREKMPSDFDIKISADLKMTADAPVKLEFYNEGTKRDFAIGSTNNKKLTIGENVHFDLVDRVIWIGFWGNNVDVVVDGYLGGYQIWHGADTTVNATGTLDSHGEAFIMRRDATLTVNSGKVNANYFHIYSGHINAENATITAGLVWIYNNHNYGSEGTVSFALKNTNFTSRGEVKVYAGEDKKVAITLTNNTSFVANGALTMGEGVSVTADVTSKFTASAVSAGKIIIDATNFVGTAVEVIKANMSGFTGTIEVINNDKATYKIENDVLSIVEKPVATVNGVGYASFAEAYDAAQSGDTLTLLADVELSATLTIKKSIIINGNGKTLTYTGQNRAIDVPSEANGANVTIKNLTVDCTASYCQRGINYNTFGTLTLDNVVVKGQNVTYAVNLPGSSDNATVIINNSALSGNIALNIWGENTTVTATDTVFTSIDNTEAENYFAISINNDGFTAAHNTTLTINGGEIIAKDEKGAPSTAIGAATFATITVSESTIVVGSIMKPVAIVTYAGATEFYSCATLQDAVNKASNDPKATVKLIANFELSETVVVKGTVTLDLNGKTITGTDNNTTGNFYLINNDKGNLTIIDSVGGGKITLVAKNQRNWNASSVVVANNLGTVTVKGGTIEHLGSTDMAYAIDNLTNGANTVATLNVEGGTIESTYFAIRQFANGGTNNLNISGGDIGYTWMQSPNDNVNVATINVTGGEVDGICLTGKNADVTMEVAAGTTSEVYGTAPAGMTIVGTPEAGFGLMAAVAKVGEVSYASLQEAINAANNATVVVLADIDLGSTTVKIPAGTKVTLDLNGKTISGECNANQASMFVVENTATFIVKDTATNGKITYAAGASNVGFEIDVKGAFVLESGIIELTGSWSLGFAVDVRPNSWGSEYTAGSSFVMNGGKISSSDTAVRVASSSATGHENVSASFTMNGGVIESGWDAIFIQHWVACDYNVALNGGKVSGDNSAIRIYGTTAINDVTLAVSGGEYTGKLVNLGVTGNGTTAIAGGTFSEPVDATWCANGFVPVENADGTFGVETQKFIGVNLTVGKDLSVNFYIENGLADASATMTFSLDDRQDEVMTGTLVTEGSQDLWKFTFYGVGPQKMGKTITAVLRVNGNIVKTITYSIEDYCYEQLAISAEEMNEQYGYTKQQYEAYQTFLVNVLNYGAASQLYANYEEEDLVTDRLTEDQKAMIGEYHAVEPTTYFEDTKFAEIRVGKMVRFGAANSIRVAFMARSGVEVDLSGWKIEVYGNHHAGTVMTPVWDEEEGYYYVEVADILATEYNIQYMFMFVDGNGTRKGMITYSIQHDVYLNQNSTNADIANLMKAVWNYGHAANDYIDLFY